nr:MAG TPA: hypothetical protein [Caudoviricetes sp.]
MLKIKILKDIILFYLAKSRYYLYICSRINKSATFL